MARAGRVGGPRYRTMLRLALKRGFGSHGPCESIRFSIGEPDGPRSQVYTVFRRGNDVYVAMGASRGELKISLHESGAWRVAITAEHLARPDRMPVLPPSGRVLARWKRPPNFIDGALAAFSVLIPGAELRRIGEVKYTAAGPLAPQSRQPIGRAGFVGLFARAARRLVARNRRRPQADWLDATGQRRSRVGDGSRPAPGGVGRKRHQGAPRRRPRAGSGRRRRVPVCRSDAGWRESDVFHLRGGVVSVGSSASAWCDADRASTRMERSPREGLDGDFVNQCRRRSRPRDLADNDSRTRQSERDRRHRILATERRSARRHRCIRRFRHRAGRSPTAPLYGPGRVKG